MNNMSIGTSSGAYYEDEFHMAVNPYLDDPNSTPDKIEISPDEVLPKEEPDSNTYETSLTPADEIKFHYWKSRVAPNDSGYDYDLRGAFKAGVSPAENGHWPDTFKKPNHPTFSNQSIYAKDRPDLAGSWNGDIYVSPKAVDL